MLRRERVSSYLGEKSAAFGKYFLYNAPLWLQSTQRHCGSAAPEYAAHSKEGGTGRPTGHVCSACGFPVLVW